MKRFRTSLFLIFALLIQCGIARLYELNVWCMMIFAICGCIALRRIRCSIQREKMYEKEYQEVVTYLEQLLCSYRRLGHAGKALEDCSTVFEPENKMGIAIQRARHIMMTGDGVEDGYIMEAAFSEIEKEYDSRRVKIIHNFICNSERSGGDTQASVDILLEDLEYWKNRTSTYEKRKTFIKAECAIATALSVILCYVSQLLTPDELGFQISDSLFYQGSTTVVLVCLWMLLILIYKKLSVSWLDLAKQGEKEIQRLEHLYQVLKKHGEGTSRLSRHVAKRVVGRFVKSEFPYCLLLVTLYLQTESSYQALKKTIRQMGGIIGEEIEQLTERIYDSPRDLQPYLQFFEELEIPEVQTGMKILYSVSTNGYEDTRRQLDFLVAQNNRLMDRSETYIQTSKMGGLSLLKQLPMVLSCVKLLMDLINLLTMTMGNFQTMYG